MILGADGRPAPGQEVRRCAVLCRFVIRVTPENAPFLVARFRTILGPQAPAPVVGMEIPVEGLLFLSTEGGKPKGSPMLLDPAGVDMSHPALMTAILGHQMINRSAAVVARQILGIPVDEFLYPSNMIEPPADAPEEPAG